MPAFLGRIALESQLPIPNRASQRALAYQDGERYTTLGVAPGRVGEMGRGGSLPCRGWINGGVPGGRRRGPPVTGVGMLPRGALAAMTIQTVILELKEKGPAAVQGRRVLPADISKALTEANGLSAYSIPPNQARVHWRVISERCTLACKEVSRGWFRTSYRPLPNTVRLPPWSSIKRKALPSAEGGATRRGSNARRR